MVARTGFEPVIFALRGRCPKPLDERAIMALAGRGWDGESRTPVDGTRIRCPTTRRHPNVVCPPSVDVLNAKKHYTDLSSAAQA